MRKGILVAVLLLLAFLVGAKTSETVNTWKTGVYKVTAVVDSGKVRVVFIDKNLDNVEVERCGQTITAQRASDLSIDLAEAAVDATP